MSSTISTANDSLAIRSPRLFSAICFGITALIPVVIFLSLMGFREVKSELLLLSLIFVIPPTAIAVIMGAIIGAKILDLKKEITRLKAFGIGALVGFSSYIIYSVGYIVSSSIRDIGSISLTTYLLEAIGAIFYGAIIILWAILIAGGLCGIFLHSQRPKKS